MIDKIEKRFKDMNLSCYTPEEMYYLILALQEFEVYKKLVGDKGHIVIISELSPEDYD